MTGNNDDNDEKEDDKDDAGVITLAKGMEQNNYIKTEVRGCLPSLILCLLTRYEPLAVSTVPRHCLNSP